MTTPTLRPETDDDRPFLFEVFRGTLQRELDALALDDHQKEAFLRWQFEAQWKDYHTRFGEGEFSVIMLGDRPVGRLVVVELEQEHRFVDIAILPEERGRGIGTAVIERLLERVAPTGKPARFQVERTNQAMRLYERMGFRIVGGSATHYLMERGGDEAPHNDDAITS